MNSVDSREVVNGHSGNANLVSLPRHCLSAHDIEAHYDRFVVVIHLALSRRACIRRDIPVHGARAPEYSRQSPEEYWAVLR